MTLYVIKESSWEDAEVIGIFSTREKADEFCRAKYGEFHGFREIEEWPLDPEYVPDPPVEIKPSFIDEKFPLVSCSFIASSWKLLSQQGVSRFLPYDTSENSKRFSKISKNSPTE